MTKLLCAPKKIRRSFMITEKTFIEFKKVTVEKRIPYGSVMEVLISRFLAKIKEGKDI